jgi:hypothetical protein
VEFLISLFGEISPVKKHAKSMYLHEHKSGVVVYRKLSQAAFHSIELRFATEQQQSRKTRTTTTGNLHW